MFAESDGLPWLYAEQEHLAWVDRPECSAVWRSNKDAGVYIALFVILQVNVPSRPGRLPFTNRSWTHARLSFARAPITHSVVAI